MSEQDGRQAVVQQRPATNNFYEWKAYWKAQGQPWRTEQEIDAERQKYLEERRKVMPDIMNGIYPFKDIKLSRADVEWLLATHESQGEIGPVDWSDEGQRERIGLDVRGADLQEVDLSNLPLARLCAGLNENEWHKASTLQVSAASVSFRGANLSEAHLEEADLVRAHLEGAALYKAHLEGADLRDAFFDASSTFRGATLGDAERFVSVADIRWGGVNLAAVKWAHEKRAKTLILGDERKARRRTISEGILKDKEVQLGEYERAIRANRQLANALRGQGLSELADYFAYRGQRLQRFVFRRQGKFGLYLSSLCLDILAGYGYRPLRSLMIYLLLIGAFAIGYYEVTHILHAQPYPLAWYEALILSVSSFHGRGFFQPVQSLGDPVAVLASIEAIIGLFVEINFIATFTQRFLGR